MKNHNTAGRALRFLAKAPATAGEVGSELWPQRTGRCGVSVNGGGDYPAQMLLGRLRKQGFVKTMHTEGSSIWCLTDAGRAYANQR